MNARNSSKNFRVQNKHSRLVMYPASDGIFIDVYNDIVDFWMSVKLSQDDIQKLIQFLQSQSNKEAR